MKKTILLLTAILLSFTLYTFAANYKDIEGTGQQVTQKFYLKQGLAIFGIYHGGNSHFSVTLIDETGETIDLLANVIGEFRGSKALNIKKSGQYLCNINADGNWIVRISQPILTNGKTKPIKFTGKGQQISDYMKLNIGLTIFKMTHSGTGHFAVSLLSSNGETIELLANDIGGFNGSKAVKIKKQGIYLLQIQADGVWHIEVK